VWPTGGMYCGQWKDDSMHGWGKYVRSDGTAYEGWWRNDAQFGQGRKTIQERICYGNEKVSTVQRVFAEEWNENRQLVRQREVLIHPGAQMHFTLFCIEALTDCVVFCPDEDTCSLSEDCAEYTLIEPVQMAWEDHESMRKSLCCSVRTFRRVPTAKRLELPAGFTAQLSPLSIHDQMMEISSPRSSRSTDMSSMSFEALEIEDVKEGM